MPTGILARLGGWWGALLTLIISTLTTYLGKRAALAVAVAAIYLALVGTLWAAIAALFTSLVIAAPTGGLFDTFWMGFFLLMPANWVPCAAACLSADVAVWLYRFHASRIAPPVTGV